MYKTILAAVTAALLAGCGAKPVYVAPEKFTLDKTVQETTVTEYKLGETKTVKLGESMMIYEKIIRTMYDRTDVRFKALKDIEIKIKEDEVYKIAKDKSYVPTSSDKEHMLFHIDLKAEGKAVSSLRMEVDKEGKVLKGNLIENKQAKVGDALFSPLFTPVPRDPAESKIDTLFKQELIYAGMKNDDIVVEYREYKDNPDTPASSEELRFNLSASDFIRHKKFKLQILYTDNEKIKFTVLATPR